MDANISRRRALRLGAAALAGGAGALAGVSPAGSAYAGDVSTTVCVDTGSLTWHTAIGGASLINESSRSQRDERFNEAFFQRLYNWRFFYNDHNPWSLLSQVWNYGAYADRGDGCVSMHNYGRALDITRGYGPDTGNTLQFLARYDIWKNYTGDTLVLYRRRYWAAAASLHHFFRHTLTYRFNTDHHNHIHVDNELSGTGYSTFSTGSTTQVQSVQAMLSYVWGYSERNTSWSEGIDGDRCAAVLTRIGVGGRITSGQSYWLAFLRATVRKGTGLQSY